MKKFLVTGGAGFIGSHIAHKLISAGKKVVVVDNLRTGYEQNIPSEAEFIELDIRNAAALSRLDRLEFDAVLHLAAQSSGEISFDDPDYDLDANARGTLNLLRWAEGRSVKRFVNASSMGVYGDVSTDRRVREDQPLRPLSFYGASKLAAEGYCNYFIKKGMAVTSFRMFNVYGPGQNLANLKQGMVSIYLKYFLDGLPVEVKGSMERFRDFIYIDDVVSAWLCSLERSTTFGRVYNLGTGSKTHVHELIDALRAAWGEPDYPVHYLEGTPGDQFGIVADVTALRRDLGWQAGTGLLEGIRAMVDASCLRESA